MHGFTAGLPASVARGHSGAPVTTYTYDDLGRPNTIPRGTTSPTSVVYHCDAVGRLTDIDYGNGTSVQHGYDAGNRLLWIKSGRAGSARGL